MLNLNTISRILGLYYTGKKGSLKFSEGNNDLNQVVFYKNYSDSSAKGVEGMKLWAEKPGKKLIQTRDKKSLN